MVTLEAKPIEKQLVQVIIVDGLDMLGKTTFINSLVGFYTDLWGECTEWDKNGRCKKKIPPDFIFKSKVPYKEICKENTTSCFQKDFETTQRLHKEFFKQLYRLLPPPVKYCFIDRGPLSLLYSVTRVPNFWNEPKLLNEVLDKAIKLFKTAVVEVFDKQLIGLHLFLLAPDDTNFEYHASKLKTQDPLWAYRDFNSILQAIKTLNNLYLKAGQELDKLDNIQMKVIFVKSKELDELN